MIIISVINDTDQIFQTLKLFPDNMIKFIKHFL